MGEAANGGARDGQRGGRLMLVFDGWRVLPQIQRRQSENDAAAYAQPWLGCGEPALSMDVVGAIEPRSIDAPIRT